MPKTLGRRSLCAALTTTLAGCGFQPVYMPTASGKAGVAQRELSTVFVRIIPERPGQVLRQALQKRFADDSGTPPQYDLQVRFSVAGEGIGVITGDISTRVRLIGNASYTLLAHDAAQTVLTSGDARAVDGLNIFDEQYFASTLETEVVQTRIADNVADQIATQLAIWFRKRAAQPG
jgi:hypothetical protein